MKTANKPRENRFARFVHSKRLLRLVSWVLLPLYLWQGLSLRAKQPRLLPPKGSWIRQIGDVSSDRPLRLLIIGDSSVCGVGVAQLEDGLAVQIAVQLSQAITQPVALRLAGANSATSADLRDHVIPHLPADAFDLVLLVVGMNDAKNMHTTKRFLRHFGTLCYALKSRFPSAVVAHWPIAPMRIFPVLPQPLKAFLSLRSDAIDAYAACVCAERGVERFERYETFPPDGFAVDGFHVNEKGCALWASKIVQAFLENTAIKAKLDSMVSSLDVN